jgi:hypothetical protein
MSEPDTTVVKVAGIDWATEAKNRALVELHLDVATRRITISVLTSPLTDTEVLRTLRRQDLSAVGVDVPFGWPRSFMSFVGTWRPATRDDSLGIPPRELFSYRATDLIVQRAVGKWPLSVSSDRIALGAFAWAKLVATNHLADQVDLGAGRGAATGPTIIEVYPAATLAAWVSANKLSIEGYKKDAAVRSGLLESLFDRFRVDCSPADALALASTGKDSDKTDAFIAALTTLVYADRSERRSDARRRRSSRPRAARAGSSFPCSSLKSLVIVSAVTTTSMAVVQTPRRHGQPR